MMLKTIKILTFLIVIHSTIMAQNEYLGPIGYNSSLIQYQNTLKADVVYNNVVISSDTLSLPFIDDFSTNTLRAYDFIENNVYDTIIYATGACIDDEFEVETDSFMVNTSYSYFFDVVNQVIDSVANSPIVFSFYEGANCFPSVSYTTNFYPQPYVYSFDSTTGDKLDSTLMTADTIVEYATIYLATATSESKWVDNYAYHNTTYPINPPTIGVATLDGLNEFGQPYDNSVTNQFGYADVLTSKPIDLSGLTNDSAVFLSFFVEAQGLGDAPNSLDSLVLEFKNEYEEQWITVWKATIDDVSVDEFKQFYVEVRDTNLVTGPRYFYGDFQFRFRNLASISGNNDHWHIDYVRLDKNRAQTELDTVIRDVAFMYDFPNILQRYSQLPWSQFQAGADELATEINIPIKDNGQVNGQSAGAFPIEVLVTDSLDTDTMFILDGVNFNPTSIIKNQVFTPISDFVKPSFEGDSICINAQMKMYPTARNLLTSNDSIYSQICLNKVMAYDDGSAEKAYGLSGSPDELKKFAYKFEVAHPDTLAAIQIHFSNIDENVENLLFNLYAWDSIQIDVPLSYDNPIGVIESAKPVYFDTYNGFATFAFDTPILVENTFYIGWSQTDSENLQIGFDRNSEKGRDNMFTYTSSTWRASNIAYQGSPMIRAVLDPDYPFDTTTTGVNSITEESFDLKVYPNPTNSWFTVEIPNLIEEYTIYVFDYTGKLISTKQNNNQVDLTSASTGVYFIQTLFENKVFYSKVIKK